MATRTTTPRKMSKKNAVIRQTQSKRVRLKHILLTISHTRNFEFDHFTQKQSIVFLTRGSVELRKIIVSWTVRVNHFLHMLIACFLLFRQSSVFIFELLFQGSG